MISTVLRHSAVAMPARLRYPQETRKARKTIRHSCTGYTTRFRDTMTNKASNPRSTNTMPITCTTANRYFNLTLRFELSRFPARFARTLPRYNQVQGHTVHHRKHVPSETNTNRTFYTTSSLHGDCSLSFRLSLPQIHLTRRTLHE